MNKSESFPQFPSLKEKKFVLIQSPGDAEEAEGKPVECPLGLLGSTAVRSLSKCPEDTVIASTDLFFSVHCEGVLVHERKS